jgi:rhodanese-related sulfurtransferase
MSNIQSLITIATKGRLAKEMLFLSILAALPTLAYRPEAPASSPDPFAITLSKATSQKVLWVDARPPEKRARGTISNAVALNTQNWDAELGSLFERYQPEQAIVVYCDAGCHSAETVAGRIRELGLEPVYVLEGGYQAWEREQKHLH